MPPGVEVLIDQETLRRIELSCLDYKTHIQTLFHTPLPQQKALLIWITDPSEIERTYNIRKQQTRFYWVCSWELMESATILTPTSTSLSGILLSVRTQYPWRTRIWKNIDTVSIHREKFYQLHTETTTAENFFKAWKLIYISPQYDQEIITITDQPYYPSNKLKYFQLSWWYTSNCQMCRCGNSTLLRCGGVIDPHCQDVEIWWIHILSVAAHIKFAFIQEWTLIYIMVTHNISAFIHILNVETLIAPQYIHITP